MFDIDEDKTIYLTRGDVANIDVAANLKDGTPYVFKVGDVVRFKIFKKKDCMCVFLQKDVEVTESVESVMVSLGKEETRIGEIINRPIDYWYEVELNPDTVPQTIIGYDKAGEKIFRLLPEGGDVV